MGTLTEKSLAGFELSQPSRQETLIKKIDKRSRKLILGRRLATFTPKWWVGYNEFFILFILFVVNFLLLVPFFGQEDKINVFSAPLIPMLARLFFFLPFGHAVRLWLIILLMVFPISFYFFVRQVSGRRLTAAVAALVSSLPIGIFLACRVEWGLMVQDGAQVGSLTFGLLACLFFHRFLRSGSFKLGIISSVLITLTALTSPLGLFILFCFIIIIAFSEILLGHGRIKLARFLIVFFLALGFCAFWYNPKYVLLIFLSNQGQLMKQTLFNLLPLSFFLGPVLGTFGFLLFENRPHLQPVFIAIFLTIGFGIFYLGAGMTFANSARFLPALGTSVAFLTGVLMVKIIDFFRKPTAIKRLEIIDRYRKQISFFSGVIFAVLFSLITLKYGLNLELQTANVFELQASQKIGIWEVRQQTGLLGNIIGVMITLITIVLVVLLRRGISQWQKKSF